MEIHRLCCIWFGTYMTVFLLGLQKVSHGWVGCDKGFSWFVEVEQAIAIVEKGGRVKISSC